jgi:nicotinamide-nucleotide amidase
MTPAAILAAARAKGWRIATAESCTGGMVAAALTDIAGASDVFEVGYITYSNAAKMDLLAVREDTLATHGAVSIEVAAEMAQGAARRSGAQVAVSITGIAGPGGSEFKPEGRVCFALVAPNRAVLTQTIEFGALGRAKVRMAACDHALTLLLQAVM